MFYNILQYKIIHKTARFLFKEMTADSNTSRNNGDI
jgi:hypothetical protein